MWNYYLYISYKIHMSDGRRRSNAIRLSTRITAKVSISHLQLPSASSSLFIGPSTYGSIKAQATNQGWHQRQ